MKRTSVALLAAGVVSLVSFVSPDSARADWRDRGRQDHEIRRELRRDRAELERDREDLSRLYRNGASQREIYRKKAEIRQDMREIAEGRERLSGDYYGYNRSDNSWWNWGNGWGWGNRDRDRWRSDYRND
jgi:hypothetical protein